MTDEGPPQSSRAPSLPKGWHCQAGRPRQALCRGGGQREEEGGSLWVKLPKGPPGALSPGEKGGSSGEATSSLQRTGRSAFLGQPCGGNPGAPRLWAARLPCG